MKYFGGIEGGATHSKLLICDEKGNIVSHTTGLGTNHWMVGIPECSRRIADMVQRAKEEGGIDPEFPLYALGLSLSGCEQEATNRDLEKELRQHHPHVSDNYYVCSDTIGSIFTASPIGGLVLIAGTGSNALLKNPDGSFYGCGGWGNFIGDEGSAWYMAFRAIKLCYDDMDNFRPSIYSTERVWELIQQHFNITTRLEILDHCYAKFDKPFFAGLCAKLAEAAKEGDELCKSIFRETGEYLAKHIIALLPKVQDELVANGDLSIVCVGSVWLSFDLFQESFLKELSKYQFKFGLKFCRITKGCSFGAVYLGADNVNFPLPRSYDDNFNVLFYYNPQNNGNLNNNEPNLNGIKAPEIFVDAENVIS